MADHAYEGDKVKEWDPDAELAKLGAMPEMRSSDWGAFDVVQKLAEVNAPGAMASIVHLAMNSLHEPTRLKAAQYVVERACGRVSDLPPRQGKEDEFADFLQDILAKGE